MNVNHRIYIFSTKHSPFFLLQKQLINLPMNCSCRNFSTTGKTYLDFSSRDKNTVVWQK